MSDSPFKLMFVSSIPKRFVQECLRGSSFEDVLSIERLIALHQGQDCSSFWQWIQDSVYSFGVLLYSRHLYQIVDKYQICQNALCLILDEVAIKGELPKCPFLSQSQA